MYKPKITSVEYVLLSNLLPKYKYIARDLDNSLAVFQSKPQLYDYPGDVDHLKIFLPFPNTMETMFHAYAFGVYDHLFQTLTFENSPYEIAMLLE